MREVKNPTNNKINDKTMEKRIYKVNEKFLQKEFPKKEERPWNSGKREA